jgi:hypothetical protein
MSILQRRELSSERPMPGPSMSATKCIESGFPLSSDDT